MLMHVRVALTFLRAQCAGLFADIERGDNDRFVAASATCSDLACCTAKIGAIEIEADALAKIGHHVFCETGVGA